MDNTSDEKVYNESLECQTDSLMEIVLNTREQGQMIEALIKNQIEVKDDMISKLHKELEFYRQDSMERFTNQLIKAIVKIRKDMGKRLKSEEWKEMSPDELRREYMYTYEDLTDMLEQQNVDVYKTEPISNFDASIHQPKLEKTLEKTLDKKIKESISEGYKRGDKILIPERVIVYQYTE